MGILNLLFKQPEQQEIKQRGVSLPKNKPVTYTPDTSYIGEYDPNYPTVDQYRKMAFDPDIAFGLMFISAPLLNLKPMVLESSGDVEEDAFVLEACNIFWHDLLHTSFSGALKFGHAPHEIVYGQQDVWVNYEEDFEDKQVLKKNAIIISGFKPLDQLKVEYLLKDGGLAGLRVYDNNGTHVLDLSKGFVHTRDRQYLDFSGVARQRPCFNSWYRTEIQEQLKQRYFEKRAGSGLIVEYPPQLQDDSGNPITGQSADQNLQSAKTLAGNYQDTPYALVPHDLDEKGENKWKVYFVEDKGQAKDLFESWKKDLRTDKLRGLGITDRALTQDSTGSQAIGKEHGDTFKESLSLEANWFFANLNKYVVPLLVKYNYGVNVKMPTIGYISTDDFKQGLMKDIILKMVEQSRFGTSGKEISVLQLSKEYNIPLIDKQETEAESKEEMEETGTPGSNSTDTAMSTNLKYITTADEVVSEIGKNLKERKIEMTPERKELTKKLAIQEDDRINKLNRIEDKYLKELEPILQEQDDRLIKRLKEDVKEYNFKAISDFKIPYMGKYKDSLSKFFYEVYELGIKTIKKDMGKNGEQIKDEIPLAGRQWINFKTELNSDNLENYYKSNIKRIVSDNQNKDPDIILAKITEKLKEMRDVRLQQSVKQSGINVLNQSRTDTVAGFVKTA
jgi:hypothetical protein